MASAFSSWRPEIPRDLARMSLVRPVSLKELGSTEPNSFSPPEKSFLNQLPRESVPCLWIGVCRKPAMIYRVLSCLLERFSQRWISMKLPRNSICSRIPKPTFREFKKWFLISAIELMWFDYFYNRIWIFCYHGSKLRNALSWYPQIFCSLFLCQCFRFLPYDIAPVKNIERGIGVIYVVNFSGLGNFSDSAKASMAW